MFGKEYVVYLDVFYIINFIMDLLLIYLTGKVLKINLNRIRLIISASAGALYAVIIVILKPLQNHFLFLTLMNILAALLMIWIAFAYQGFITYFKRTITLLVITFLMSGIMNYIYYSTNLGVYIRTIVVGSTNQGLQLRKFIFATVSAYILLNVIKRFLFSLKKDHIYCDVHLSYAGKEIQAKALIDTGNDLKEPISGSDVQIAEYKVLKPLLEGDELAKEKLCVIPYHSIGKNEGILYGIRMDNLRIINEKQEKTISKPIVAIYKGTLSQNNKYSIILNKNILEGFDL